MDLCRQYCTDNFKRATFSNTARYGKPQVRHDDEMKRDSLAKTRPSFDGFLPLGFVGNRVAFPQMQDAWLAVLTPRTSETLVARDAPLRLRRTTVCQFAPLLDTRTNVAGRHVRRPNPSLGHLSVGSFRLFYV